MTAVIVSHISPDHASGAGGVGVGLFFILSGYLITTLLLAEQARTGRIALVPFYIRRALRLYPALIVMLAVFAPWASLFGNRGTAEGYLLTTAVAITYMGDVAMAVSGTTYGSFMHTWSLAVEEHFYLAWPLVLAFAIRHRRNPLPLAAGASILSFTLMAATTSPDQQDWDYRLNFTFHTRAYELMLGCILALWLTHRGPVSRVAARTALVAGAAGTASVIFALTLVPGGPTRPVLLAVASVAGLALVGGVASGQSATFVRALDVSALRWLGGISYGAYLFHIPVLDLAKHYIGNASQAILYAAVVPVTLMLAQASFVLVERPLARRGRASLARHLAQRRSQGEQTSDGSPTATPVVL